MNQYRGVSWHKLRKMFRVKCFGRGKHFNMGYFADPEIAAKVYDCTAVLLHGAEAVLNFDGEPPHEIPKAVIVKKLLDQGAEREQLYL